MWPRISMRMELVCSATFDARVFAFSSFNAVFRIRIFTISRVSSCLSISLFIWLVVPSLPIQIVGLSVVSSCFILRFILAVIMSCSFSCFLTETAYARRRGGKLQPDVVLSAVGCEHDNLRLVR